MSRLSLFVFLLTFMALACKSDQEKPQAKTPSTSKAESKGKPEAQAKEGKPVVLFFGNSLTAGYRLDKSESFPSRIQAIADSVGIDVRVVNAGLSGETSSGGLNRVDWVLRQQVDVFVLELGPNDMLRGLPIEATRENLDGILNRVKAKYPEVKLVVAEMLAPPNMGAEYAKAFQQMYSELAEAHGAVLVPFFLQDVVGKPDLMLDDGKHPNAKGQRVVARHVWRHMRSVLEG